MATFTLGEIAKLLNCPAPAGADTVITGIATLQEAGPKELSFLGSDAYLDQYQQTKAAAVLVSRKVRIPEPSGKTAIVVDNADLAVAQVLEKFAPPVPRPPMGVDSSAIVEPTAVIAAGRVGREKRGDRCWSKNRQWYCYSRRRHHWRRRGHR